MKSIYLDRSGLLKNTTFAILSPNGKEKLTRAGRGPFFEYRNARAMASGMDKIAKTFKVDAESATSDVSLPFAESVEIGLNISSADVIPMVVLVSNDEEQAKALEEKLVPLAWRDENIIGQFTYAKASSGLSGKVLAQFDAKVSDDDLKTALADGIKNCKRIAKDHNGHVNLGIKLGIDWESEIPESDPESAAARKRMRGN